MWLGKKAPKPLPIVRHLKNRCARSSTATRSSSARLDPDTWTSAAPRSPSTRDGRLRPGALRGPEPKAMTRRAIKSVQEARPRRISEHLVSYAMLHIAQLPYLFSLFHQNKERNFLEKFEHETSPGLGASASWSDPCASACSPTPFTTSTASAASSRTSPRWPTTRARPRGHHLHQQARADLPQHLQLRPRLRDEDPQVRQPRHVPAPDHEDPPAPRPAPARRHPHLHARARRVRRLPRREDAQDPRPGRLPHRLPRLHRPPLRRPRHDQALRRSSCGRSTSRSARSSHGPTTTSRASSGSG
jgi:hypothetical protein